MCLLLVRLCNPRFREREKTIVPAYDSSNAQALANEIALHDLVFLLQFQDHI